MRAARYFLLSSRLPKAVIKYSIGRGGIVISEQRVIRSTAALTGKGWTIPDSYSTGRISQTQEDSIFWTMGTNSLHYILYNCIIILKAQC